MPHGHSHCKHILKVCEPCDVAYCNKCNKEWRGHCSHGYYPSIWYSTPNAYGTNTTSGTHDGGSQTDTVYTGHNHSGAAVGS